MAKPIKLNSMRRLESAGIDFGVHRYDPTLRSAEAVAEALGLEAGVVFKTLVASTPEGPAILALIPGDRQLDTKALARAAGVKRAAMASQVEAEALTGLQIGGISPLATAVRMRTFVDQRSAELPAGRVVISAGRRGFQLELAVEDLLAVTDGRLARLCRDGQDPA